MATTPHIHLLTAATMNGWKPIIFLEEAGVPYELTHIDFDKNEQKADWYVRLNPNGRIPTLIDRGNDDFTVFESNAILWYLADKYQRFLPPDSDAKGRSEALQWLMFQVSGVGPMMGQAMYFQRIAAPRGEHHPFAIDRFIRESRRLLEVVDAHLDGRSFMLGEAYTIVDIAMYPYARSHFWANVPVDDLRHLGAWFERLDARPAIQRALQLPRPHPEFFGEGGDATIDAAVAANAKRFTL